MTEEKKDCNKPTTKEAETVQDYYINAKQVQSICGVSETKSYLIIKKLNDELKEQGFITIRDKVLRSYFNKRIGVGVQ